MKTSTAMPLPLVLWLGLVATAVVIPSSSALPSSAGSLSLHSTGDASQPTHVSASPASVETRAAKVKVDAVSQSVPTTTTATAVKEQLDRSASPISHVTSVHVSQTETERASSSSTREPSSAAHTSASEVSTSVVHDQATPSASPPPSSNNLPIALQPIVVPTSASPSTAATGVQGVAASSTRGNLDEAPTTTGASHSAAVPFTEVAHVAGTTETPKSHDMPAAEDAANEDPEQDETAPTARNIIVSVFSFLATAAVACCFKDKLDALYRRIRNRRARRNAVSANPWTPIPDVNEKTPVTHSPADESRSDWRRSMLSVYSSQPPSPLPPGSRGHDMCTCLSFSRVRCLTLA